MDIDTDKQFYSWTIAEVGTCESGWDVKWDNGFSLYVTDEQCKVPPAPGESARLYGKGLGYTVRGIVIAGRVYRYQSEQEEREAHAKWVEDEKRKKREALERDRPERDRRIAALPEPLRLRIERFQAISPDWRAAFEPYELFVCEEAATIFKALPTRAEIAEFSRLSHGEQGTRIAELRLAEHSGNTFSAACNLAALLADGGELVAKQHGALCPLVGCEEYGCFAAHEGKRDA